jgi:hypothetical protein
VLACDASMGEVEAATVGVTGKVEVHDITGWVNLNLKCQARVALEVEAHCGDLGRTDLLVGNKLRSLFVALCVCNMVEDKGQCWPSPSLPQPRNDLSTSWYALNKLVILPVLGSKQRALIKYCWEDTCDQGVDADVEAKAPASSLPLL